LPSVLLAYVVIAFLGYRMVTYVRENMKATELVNGAAKILEMNSQMTRNMVILVKQ
jgi:hypothetical protein